MQDAILIVDDAELNRELLCQLFEQEYTVFQAADGLEALALLEAHREDLRIVLLDVVMPVMDGFGVLERMCDSGFLGKIPVVLITGDNSLSVAKRGYEYGTADIITKPFEPDIVRRRVKNIIDLYQHKNRLEHLVDLQTKEIEKQKMRIKEYDNFLIDTLSTVVEFRSLESGQHIQRIRMFTKAMLNCMLRRDKNLHISKERVDIISSASALHDVGKIAIPDSILLKPGRLTADEFEVMKTHTIKGCGILESMRGIYPREFFQISYDICRSHHERWDGGGYPDGLKGTQIPLAAQVVSIVDVYDALVSERCYKEAYSAQEAQKMILDGQCGIFSPKLLEHFLAASEEITQIVERSNADITRENR